MKRDVSERKAKLRHQRKVEAFWGISIILLIFGTTAYFALKEDNKPNKDSNAPITHTLSTSTDSIKSIRENTTYSDFYYEGYEKGYAAGEEDTNDGDYQSGYNDTNKYEGKNALDYCLGYNHGYEDAYEEISEYSDDEEPI